MHEEKYVSFYPDFSKNHEFIKRITGILNRPDSSIGLCYISMSMLNRFCVFIEPLDCKEDSNQIAFGFDKSDRLLNKESREKYISNYVEEGYSKSDLESLVDLFTDFSFNSYYEGLFFGSKFFDVKFREPTKSYILKYTSNEKANRYVIEGKKLSRHYAKATLPYLKDVIEKSAFLRLKYSDDSILFPCNIYLLSETGTLEETVKKIQQISETEFFIIEYYKDKEIVGGYIKSVYQVNGHILNSIDFKKL